MGRPLNAYMQAACLFAVVCCGAVSAQEPVTPKAPSSEAGTLVASSRKPHSLHQVQIVANRRKSTLPVEMVKIVLPAESFALSGTPEAEPRTHKLFGVVGAGLFAEPAYSGARALTATPVPFVDIHGLLHGRMFLSSERGVGIYLGDFERVRAGIALNYGEGRKSSNDLHLRGLPDIGAAVEADGFVAYALDPVAMELRVRRRFGASAGTQIEVGASLETAPLPRFRLSFGLGLAWADSRYQRQFYGVTSADAARAAALGNPLEPYAPHSGLTTLETSFGTIYEISPHWGLVARLQLQDLIGRQTRTSPLVQRAVQPFAGVGVVYQFHQ